MLSELKALYSMSHYTFRSYSPREISPAESRRTSPVQTKTSSSSSSLNQPISQSEITSLLENKDHQHKVVNSKKGESIENFFISIMNATIVTLVFVYWYPYEASIYKIGLLFAVILLSGTYEYILGWDEFEDDSFFDSVNEIVHNNDDILECKLLKSDITIVNDLDDQNFQQLDTSNFDTNNFGKIMNDLI